MRKLKIHAAGKSRRARRRTISNIVKQLDRVDRKVNRHYEQIQEQLAQILIVAGETITEYENRHETCPGDHQDLADRAKILKNH